MRSIRYIGDADFRSVRSADFAEVGINDQATVSWEREEAQSVSDLAAAFLLAFPAEFEDVGGATFADLGGGAGREIGLSKLNVTTAVAATAATDVPNWNVSFTPGVRGLRVVIDCAMQIYLTGSAGRPNHRLILVDDLGTTLATRSQAPSLETGDIVQVIFHLEVRLDAGFYEAGTPRNIKVQHYRSGPTSEGIVWANENPSIPASDALLYVEEV